MIHFNLLLNKGNWWDERDDWIALGNLITRPGRGIDNSLYIVTIVWLDPRYRIYRMLFLPVQRLLLQLFYHYFREYALGDCRFLSARKYYLLPSLEENHCPRVFYGFF